MNDLFYITADFYIYDLIGLLIIYQSLVFGVFILVRKGPKVSLSNSLEFIYLTILLHFGYVMLENNWLSGTYMFGLFFGLLYGPLFYLYTTSLVLDEQKFTKRLVHFVPAMIALAVVLIINLFGSNFLIEFDVVVSVVVTTHMVTYLIGSLLLLNSYTVNLPRIQSSLDRISLRWLKVTIYLIFASMLLALAESFITPIFPYYTSLLITLIFLFVLVLVNCLYYLGFRQANLFSGFSQEEIDRDQKGSKYDIPSEEKSVLFEALSLYMDSNNPYRQFELSLNDLAKALDTTTRKLSLVINDMHRRNFFDFINSYRIKEVTNLLETTDKSIKEIMYSCGFGNKSSFNAIFKKHTGKTPSDFRENKS